MAHESITVAFGADLSALGSGIRTAKSMIRDLKDALSPGEIFGKFKEGLGMIGIGFGAEKMYEGIKAAGELAHKIEVLADTYGVSTKFLQEFEYAARKSNSSTESADLGMRKLTETIGQAREGQEDAIKKFERFGITLQDASGRGLTTQEVVEQISAKMGEIEDPTVRAAMAFELFGRKGAELVQTLKDLDALKGKADKKILDESELAALTGAKRNIEAMEGFFKNIALHAAAVASSVFSFGRATDADAIRKNLDRVGEGGEQKQTEVQIRAAKEYAKALEDLRRVKQTSNVNDPYLKALIEQKDAEREVAATKEGTVEHVRAEIKLIEKTNELEKQRHELDVKAERDKEAARHKRKEEDERQKRVAQELLEKQIQIRNATEARDKAAANYSTAFGDRSKFSLQELADLGRSHFQNRQLETGSERTAIDIQNLEERSKQARLYGNSDYADDLQKQSLEMRKSLGGVLQSGDADPMKGLRETSEKAQKHLEDLLTLAAGKGIAVKTDDTP